MKKLLFGILTLITLIGFSFITPVSVFAAEGEPCTCYDSEGRAIGRGTKLPTAILDKSACDCGHGEAIISILHLVVEILSIGVGILGVIGISVVGIQYLTAGGSEEKTRKAKRRMFEIMLGLVGYAVSYAALKFLLPGF